MHRHAWSEANLKEARDEYVNKKVREFKDNFSSNSVSTTASKGSSFNSSGMIEGALKFLGAGGSTAATVNSGKTLDNSTTNSSSGPSQYQINQVKDEAGAFFLQNFETLSSRDPDIQCFKNGDCRSPKGRSPKPDNKKSEKPMDSDESSSKSKYDAPKDEGSNRKSEGNKSSSSGPNLPKDEIFHRDQGKWAGEPENNRPGEMYVHYAQDDGREEPLNDCLSKEHRKLMQEAANTEFTQDGKTKEQEYKEAQENLKLGHCDESILGKDFCKEFHFNKNAHWVQDTKDGAQQETNSKEYKPQLSVPCPEGLFQGGHCIAIDSQSEVEDSTLNTRLLLDKLKNDPSMELLDPHENEHDEPYYKIPSTPYSTLSSPSSRGLGVDGPILSQ